MADDDYDHDRRLAMYAERGRTALVWGFILLGSVGWPEWLAGLFVASAAYTLGAME